MNESIETICQQLIVIKDQLAENEELESAVMADDKAEDLLVAMAMAIAYSEDAINLSELGEEHLRFSLEDLMRISQAFEEGE